MIQFKNNIIINQCPRNRTISSTTTPTCLMKKKNSHPRRKSYPAADLTKSSNLTNQTIIKPLQYSLLPECSEARPSSRHPLPLAPGSTTQLRLLPRKRPVLPMKPPRLKGVWLNRYQCDRSAKIASTCGTYLSILMKLISWWLSSGTKVR